MQPFSAKLSYNGKPWTTVSLEVGHDEIGDADEPDFVEPIDANTILRGLGFPLIGPVPVMPLRYQIAQKLHAVSEPGSIRAHDLIDLQLIDATYSGDYVDVKAICERLFTYRKKQSWPPVIVANPTWEKAHVDQLPNGSILPTVNQAAA